MCKSLFNYKVHISQCGYLDQYQNDSLFNVTEICWFSAEAGYQFSFITVVNIIEIIFLFSVLDISINDTPLSTKRFYVMLSIIRYSVDCSHHKCTGFKSFHILFSVECVELCFSYLKSNFHSIQ